MKYNRRLIFFDFEVFSKSVDPVSGKAWWMMVLCDYDTKKGKVIVNDIDELRKYYELFKNDIWVGFNCRNYDQYIFKGLLLGYDPGYINDQIIENNKKGWQVVRDGNKIPLITYDISDGFRSLKELEGFMGTKIKESSVPFDLDRPLTDEEIKEVIDYCIYDVRETIEVFEHKTNDFEAQLGLIEMFNLDMSLMSKTKAQLSAIILGAEKHPDRGDEFEFEIPKNLKLGKYEFIREWYENPENKSYKMDIPKKSGEGTRSVNRQLITDIAGVEHVLGFGGIHGSRDNYFAEGIILCADVALI